MDPNFPEVFQNFDLSAESSGNPTLRDELKRVLSRSEKSGCKKSRTRIDKPLPNTPRSLREEILKSLPRDVEPYRVDYFHIPLKGGGSFPFFIVKGFVPKERIEDLISWRNEFEKQHGITVFPQIRDVPKTLKTELCEIAGERGIITKNSLPILRKIINASHDVETLPKRDLHHEDKTDLSWFSIDGPEVKNREDILCVERERDGIRLYIGFADQSIYLPPDSPIEKHGRRQVNALHVKNHSPTVVGHLISGEVSNFIEGEKRYAWVVEVFLGDNGKICEEAPYRASVVNRNAYVNGEFFSKSPSGVRDMLVRAIDRLPKKRGVEAKRRTTNGLSEVLISQAMVYAKSRIASFLHEKGVPALYRNHQAPEKKDIIKLVRAYRELGIPAEFDDFTDPLRLAALCRLLNSRATLPLLSATLSLIYFPSTVSFNPEEHAGVGEPKYCEIKPHKNYAGMFNEYALGHALYGEPLPSFAHDPVKRRSYEREINLAIQTRDLDSFRYQRIRAIVAGLRKDKVYTGIVDSSGRLEVTGGVFAKLESIGIKCRLNGPHEVGRTYRLRPLGYDPYTSEFIFERENSKRSFTPRARSFASLRMTQKKSS